MNSKPKPVVAFSVAVLACGCAGTTKEQVAQPQTRPALEIVVKPELPQSHIHTRDHHRAKRALRATVGGLAGAGLSIGYGCILIPIVGCIAGAVVAPVGAVAGAVAGASNVQSTDHYHSVDSASGADGLIDTARKADLPALLADAVRAQNLKRHGELRIELTAFDLFGETGETGENARLALVVTARAELHAADEIWREQYSYESSRRRVADWMANDARLLHEAISKALREISVRMAQDLRAKRVLHAAAPRLGLGASAVLDKGSAQLLAGSEAELRNLTVAERSVFPQSSDVGSSGMRKLSGYERSAFPTRFQAGCAAYGYC